MTNMDTITVMAELGSAVLENVMPILVAVEPSAASILASKALRVAGVFFKLVIVTMTVRSSPQVSLYTCLVPLPKTYSNLPLMASLVLERARVKCLPN